MPVQQIAIPSGLLSCFLLIPLRGQEARQKQVAIPDWRRWAKMKIKTGLLIFNIVAMIACYGLMHFADGAIHSRYVSAISDLNGQGYLNDAKIKAELPDSESGVTLQAAEYGWSQSRPFGGGIVAKPAMLMFLMNAWILATVIIVEKVQKRKLE